MELFLSGKTALVTGATRGIGRAVAEALLTAGAAVAICGRDRKNVDTAVAEMKPLGHVIGFAADVSRLEDVRTLVKETLDSLGRLDILINNAGVGVFQSVEQLKPEDWRLVIDLNLTGVYYCCHEALPYLKKNGDGYIFNISSLAGKNPFKGGAAYNASKFGLEGFTEAMLLDHRYDGIRATSIMPGSVDTEFGGPHTPDRASSAWKIAPSDIADIVLNLLRLPKRSLVSRVEVRPSAPPR
jgi:3-oxoacyl-[acyl-carrier protein] reductase